jgi:hypothetical protein
MKKKLPIGIQTFEKIRDPEHNYVYVDKTRIALELLQNGTYYFLSRPRRFGKSLFLDTLSEIFKGSKHLFHGLYIYGQYDWSQTFPVINISFAEGNFKSSKAILETIETSISNNAASLNVDVPHFSEDNIGLNFSTFIHSVYDKYGAKVVILIDEYDKPILDNIETEMAVEAREVLRVFYSSIKASDQYIRFAMLTGVSKFSKLSLFSGLNNLHDITLHKSFSTITGYTHQDFLDHFAEYLDGVDIEEVRRWYNGYNFLGEAIYNPFDILLFLSNGCTFSNYWWNTGSPSFLIKMLRTGRYYLPELENIIVGEETLNAFDVDRIDIVALLWQTGYLTFDRENRVFNRISYKMKVPNIEVQNSLNALFLDYLTDLRGMKTEQQDNTAMALYEGDMQRVESVLRRLFASIPYNNYVNNTIAEYEGYYASVMFVFLASLGFAIIAEDTTNRGRIDLALKVPGRTYIVEFKVDMPTETAMHQIRTKKYYEKYLAEGVEICLVGIHFSSEERNISSFEWETAPGI